MSLCKNGLCFANANYSRVELLFPQALLKIGTAMKSNKEIVPHQATIICLWLRHWKFPQKRNTCCHLTKWILYSLNLSSHNCNDIAMHVTVLGLHRNFGLKERAAERKMYTSCNKHHNTLNIEEFDRQRYYNSKVPP